MVFFNFSSSCKIFAFYFIVDFIFHGNLLLSLKKTTIKFFCFCFLFLFFLLLKWFFKNWICFFKYFFKNTFDSKSIYCQFSKLGPFNDKCKLWRYYTMDGIKVPKKHLGDWVYKKNSNLKNIKKWSCKTRFIIIVWFTHE